MPLPALPAGALVRHVHGQVGGAGGPHGYLANLRWAVYENRVAGIDITDVPVWGKWNWRSKLWHALDQVRGVRGLLHRMFGEFQMRFRRSLREWDSNYDMVGPAECNRLLACDLLFVHDTFLARRLARLAPAGCRERVVLVSHAPTYIANQIAAYVMPDADPGDWADASLVRSVRDLENETFELVRAVAWPYAAAHEGYSDYANLEAQGRVRSVGIVTGVPSPQPRRARAATRTEWGVGDRPVALFMGRPHPDKGFDRFLDWAETGHGDDWVFAFAGNPATRWKREIRGVQLLGYQSDNGAAYRAADLVLIPNRTSFLDIGLLEALSLGVPTATTATGGHREVLRRVPELIEIPTGDARTSWAAVVDAWRTRSTPEAAAARRKAWEERYSPRAFVRAHLEASLALLEGRAWPPE